MIGTGILKGSRRSAGRPRRLGLVRGRRARVLAQLVLAALLALAAYAGLLAVTQNFHTVVPGILDRSAQPSGRDLEADVADHGIRTVANLRGAWPAAQSYDEERATARRLGVTLIDVRMSAHEPLAADRARTLIRRLRMARPPILVHGKSGADRTGLVSAIDLAAVCGLDPDVAAGQMSTRFGHFGLPGTGAYAMNGSFAALRPPLASAVR